MVILLTSHFAIGQEAPEADIEEIPHYQLEREKAVGEKLEKLRTIKGKVYENVTIREISDKGMRIIHSGGVAGISLADLTYKLRKRFGYDPKRAAALEKKELEQGQARQIERAKVTEKNRETRKERDLEYAKEMLSEKKKTKIAELEKRILSMNKGIAKAHVEIKAMSVKAADYRARGRRWVTVTGNDGRTFEVERVTKSYLNRASTLDKLIAKMELQIAAAKGKIQELTLQISQIKNYKED